MVQDYAFGKYLGFLQVKFDENGVVTEYGGNPILLNNSIPEGEILKPFILIHTQMSSGTSETNYSSFKCGRGMRFPLQYEI